MFKLQPNPTFRAKVGISVAGQAAPVSVEIEFRHLSKIQIKSYFDGLQNKSDAEALEEIIVGWTGFDQPFSATALASLVENYPAAAFDLFDAFRRELLEAKRKN